MRHISLFFILCSPLFIKAQAPYQYKAPEKTNDSWETGNAPDEGFNPQLFSPFFDALNKEKHKLHSVLIIKNDKLIMEEYFNGYDWEKQQDLRSVNKSIASLLLGIALEKGYIKSLDEPAVKYIEEFKDAKNPDPRKNEITIRHLITMSTGLECNDWDKKSAGQEDRLFKRKVWIQSIVNIPMTNDPGTVSNYCTAGVILMKEIIERASGMAYTEFAKTHLLAPLGITNYRWGHTNKKEVISAGKRLYMAPRELAKIGQLVLHQGKYNNKQIVPKNWIKDINTAKTQITGIDYTYLWWKLPFAKDGKPVDVTCATGNGGQYIMIFPEYDMTVIFTGGAYNSPDDKLPFSVVGRIILPSVE